MPLASKRGRPRSKKVTSKASESKNETIFKELKEDENNDSEGNEVKCNAASSSKFDSTLVKDKRNTMTIIKDENNGTKSLADIDETKESRDSPMPIKRSARTKTRRNEKNNCTENFEEPITNKIPKRQKKDSTCNVSKKTLADGTIDYKEAINNECFVQLSQRIDSKISNEISANKNNEQLTQLPEDNQLLGKKDSDEVTEKQDRQIFYENGMHNKENVPFDNRLTSNEGIIENSYLVNSNNERKTFTKNVQTSVPSTSTAGQESDGNVNKLKAIDRDNFIKAPCHCNGKIQCYGPYSEGSYASMRMVGKGIEIKKSLKHEKTIMAGFIKIYYDSYLSGRATNNTVYFVVEGKIQVNITGNVKILHTDDCFMVIQDTEYEIRNIDAEPARLSFVKTSRLLGI